MAGQSVVCVAGVCALLSAASRTGAVPLPPPVEYAVPAGSVPVGSTRGVVGARTYNRRGTFNVAVDIVGPGGGCDVALSAARVRSHL